MKALRIALATLLCLSMVLSLVACNGDSGKVDEGIKESMSEEMKQQIAQAVSSLPKVELANKEVKWLCWDSSWNYNTETAEGRLFADAYGGKIVTDTCSYDDRYTVLANKVSSGESPDMFPFEADNFPCGVISGMYDPIDQYLDVTGDEWSYTKDLMEKYVVGGKHYVILPYSQEGDFLVYNRDTIEMHGLDDPYELFIKGEWDWNAMYDMLVAYCNADEDRYGIGGWWPEYAFVATTGTPFVSLTEGKLKSNLDSTEVAKAMNFLAKLYSEGLHYPWEKFDWSKKINFVTEGKMLFYATGEHDLKGTFRNQKKSAYCENVFIVPFPKDPDTDKYYQHLGTDAHMLVAGASNPEGVAAWQNVRRVAHYDPKVTEQGKVEAKSNYNYTDELIEALDILEGSREDIQFEGVYDFRRGVNAELRTGMDEAEGVIQELERSTYKMGLSWTEVLSQYSKQIQTYIDEANTKIDALS